MFPSSHWKWILRSFIKLVNYYPFNITIVIILANAPNVIKMVDAPQLIFCTNNLLKVIISMLY